MHAAHHHVRLIERDSRAYLLIVATRIECRIARDERHLSCGRHAARHRRHVLLCHTHLDESFGKFLLKPFSTCALSQVGAEHDDACIFSSCFYPPLSEPVTCWSMRNTIFKSPVSKFCGMIDHEFAG